MANVYLVQEDGSSRVATRIRTVNEDRELQLILERNPDLLPGNQISPEDPRRWLVIQREMPVPDPGTGQDRWSIDFLFADQDAIPTFVEVKRFADTRSRREVIAQMLEYAANGHYYWTKDQLRECAEQSARRGGTTLEDRLSALQCTDPTTVDAYFERIQENLRESQLRLVFFMEEAPQELKSLVDFLNRQMERTEVLLIEAKLFENGATRIVVPSLFGYSEEARRVKRIVTVSTEAQTRGQVWDEERFFLALKEKASIDTVNCMRKLYDYGVARPVEISWGKGKKTGVFGFVLSAIRNAAFLTAATNGNLGLNFGWFNDPQYADFRHRFLQIMVDVVGLTLPPDATSRWITLPSDVWCSKVDKLIDACDTLIKEFGLR